MIVNVFIHMQCIVKQMYVSGLYWKSKNKLHLFPFKSRNRIWVEAYRSSFILRYEQLLCPFSHWTVFIDVTELPLWGRRAIHIFCMKCCFRWSKESICWCIFAPLRLCTTWKIWARSKRIIIFVRTKVTVTIIIMCGLFDAFSHVCEFAFLVDTWCRFKTS